MVPAAGLIAPGLQASAETNTEATKFKGAVCAPPFRLAVTLTLWLVVTVPAVAAKDADVAPAAIATEAGIVSRALPPDNATELPAGGAA